MRQLNKECSACGAKRTYALLSAMSAFGVKRTLSPTLPSHRFSTSMVLLPPSSQWRVLQAEWPWLRSEYLRTLNCSRRTVS